MPHKPPYNLFSITSLTSPSPSLLHSLLSSHPGPLAVLWTHQTCSATGPLHLVSPLPKFSSAHVCLAYFFTSCKSLLKHQLLSKVCPDHLVFSISFTQLDFFFFLFSTHHLTWLCYDLFFASLRENINPQRTEAFACLLRDRFSWVSCHICWRNESKYRLLGMTLKF